MVLVAALTVSLFAPDGVWRRFGWWPLAAATAALVATWQALPWDRRASRRRKLLGPAFLAAALLFGHATLFFSGLALYPVAGVYTGLLFGFPGGLSFAA